MCSTVKSSKTGCDVFFQYYAIFPRIHDTINRTLLFQSFGTRTTPNEYNPSTMLSFGTMHFHCRLHPVAQWKSSCSARLTSCSARRQRKKPLTPKDMTVRRAFAERHAAKNQKSCAFNLWADETKIIIFGSRNGENCHEICMVCRIEYGDGTVIIWGCLGAKNCDTCVPLKFQRILRKRQRN